MKPGTTPGRKSLFATRPCRSGGTTAACASVRECVPESLVEGSPDAGATAGVRRGWVHLLTTVEGNPEQVRLTTVWQRTFRRTRGVYRCEEEEDVGVTEACLNAVSVPAPPDDPMPLVTSEASVAGSLLSA